MRWRVVRQSVTSCIYRGTNGESLCCRLLCLWLGIAGEGTRCAGQAIRESAWRGSGEDTAWSAGAAR